MTSTHVFTSLYGSPTSEKVVDYNNEDFLSTRLNKFDEDEAVLEAEKMIVLRKALQSENPRLLVKAQGYLDNLIETRVRAQGGVSVMMDPDISQYSKGGYTSKRFALTGEYLRKMAQTPIIKSIITTRQTQVSRFSRPQRDTYEYGFKVQKKPQLYTKEAENVTSEDVKKIEYLTKFILNGGDSTDTWGNDSFDIFLQKVVEDSLTLDAGCFELGMRRSGAPYSYQAVDGATIFKSDVDSYGNYQARTGGQPPVKIRGHFPAFVQVIKDRIVADWYPWEMCYGVRNARTDITQNGYGRSELEDMISIVTSLLNTEKYNSNFFTQGSNPKGMLKVPTGANRNRIAELRQEWMSMVAGVNNAWKIPVFEGDGVEWIDMQKSNSDMEFSQWQEYLVKLACAIYKISPEEIGFSFKNDGGLGNSGKQTETRLKYSQDKGLLPLLKSIEFWINKWIISQIDDAYEFKFVGIDSEDESEELDRDIKAAGTFMGLKEVRVKRGMKPELDEDDMIANPQWIQWKSQQQMAQQQQEAQEALGEGTSMWDNIGDEDNEFVKGIMSKHQGNPMMIDAMNQFKKAMGDGKE